MTGRLGEFGRIERYFRPLASGFPGARGLTDDTASLILPADRELIVTTDAIVAGVHFIGDEPAGLIGRKALRTNLSDLASAGATPLAYTLTTFLPRDVEDGWVADLAAGLALDQAEFGICLAGGDSVSTPGPIALSITAFGSVERGRAITRAGARPGDLVMVTGTLGDAALGLAVAQSRLVGTEATRTALLDRYHLPRPRTRIGIDLVGRFATAAVDVSDGLLADLDHIAQASGVAIALDLPRLPRSEAARAVAQDKEIENAEELVTTAMLSGGDDYELVLTISAENMATVLRLYGDINVPLTVIGRVEAGSPGVGVVDDAGRAVEIGAVGYRHF